MTEARDERTVDLSTGRRSKHLLRSAGETNIPGRGEPGGGCMANTDTVCSAVVVQMTLKSTGYF